jgi:hypothetical protein
LDYELLFSDKRYAAIVKKSALGHIWAIFFTNSSGHPDASLEQSAAEKRSKEAFKNKGRFLRETEAASIEAEQGRGQRCQMLYVFSNQKS